MRYIKVTFEDGEFEEKFPELVDRTDLNESDKIRTALGLKPRKAKPGAPVGNQNAINNRGRWSKK